MEKRGLAISSVARDIVFVRKVTECQDAGEWDQWQSEMDTGHSSISSQRMIDLRSSAVVNAICHILGNAPDSQEQATESWKATGSLVGKIKVASWYADLPDSLKQDLCGFAALTTVGCKMHHSSEDELKAAENYKNEVSKSKHFPKLLVQSTSGCRLSLAVAEVSGAFEHLGGWKEDLDQALKIDALLDVPDVTQMLQEDEIRIPQGPKLIELTNKLCGLETSSTDKFISDNSSDIAKLKQKQLLFAKVIKKALLCRVNIKVPIKDTMEWLVKAHKMDSSSDDFVKAAKGHSALLMNAKKACTSSKLSVNKSVGTELGSALNTAMTECGSFLEVSAGFCTWHADVRDYAALAACEILQTMSQRWMCSTNCLATVRHLDQKAHVKLRQIIYSI